MAAETFFQPVAGFRGLSCERRYFSSMSRSKAAVWHALKWDGVLEALGVSAGHGLKEAEIAVRRERHGWNRIERKAGTPAWLRLLKQFHQPLIYILLAAAGVTLAMAEYVESGVIFGVVLVNAIVGALQEGKAQRAIAALVAATSGDIGQGASLHARIESQLGRSLPAVLMAAHGFVSPPLGSDERVRVLHKPFEIAELAEVLEAVLASTARGSSPR